MVATVVSVLHAYPTFERTVLLCTYAVPVPRQSHKRTFVAVVSHGLMTERQNIVDSAAATGNVGT